MKMVISVGQNSANYSLIKNVIMEKIFETKEGVVLYFDESTYTYQTDDINAVKNALKKDVRNYQIDVNAAIMAHNILTMIEDMDRKASIPS